MQILRASGHSYFSNLTTSWSKPRKIRRILSILEIPVTQRLREGRFLELLSILEQMGIEAAPEDGDGEPYTPGDPRPSIHDKIRLRRKSVNIPTSPNTSHQKVPADREQSEAAREGGRRYEKSCGELLEEYVREHTNLENYISRSAVLEWFSQNYPDFRKNTILTYLVKYTTNNRNRAHLGAKPEHDLLFREQNDWNRLRRYRPGLDPMPVYQLDPDNAGSLEDPLTRPAGIKSDAPPREPTPKEQVASPSAGFLSARTSDAASTVSAIKLAQRIDSVDAFPTTPKMRPSLVVRDTIPKVEDASPSVYQIEAEVEPGLMGDHRLRLRVVPCPDAPPDLLPTVLDVALCVPDAPEFTVVLKEAPRALLHDNRVWLPVGAAWTELLFSLEGPYAARLPLKLFHHSGRESVAPLSLDARFEVTRVLSPPAWHENITDEGARKVLMHLEAHGSITESEIIKLLGSPQKLRRFSNRFEEYARKVPFRVRIEFVANIKRYTKEEDK